jgi:hypothetical protein
LKKEASKFESKEFCAARAIIHNVFFPSSMVLSSSFFVVLEDVLERLLEELQSSLVAVYTKDKKHE